MPAPGPPVAAPIAAVVMPPVAPPVPAPVVPAPVVPTPVVPTIAAIPVAIAIAAIILPLCRGRARPHGGDRQAQGGSALPQDVHVRFSSSCTPVAAVLKEDCSGLPDPAGNGAVKIGRLA